MRALRTSVALGSALAALASARAARADLILDHLAPSAIKIDGLVKEWPGTTPASEVVKAGKATATVVAGYDDKGIWFGAEVVKSGAIGRTANFGPNEDCVSLIVAFPKGGVGKGAATDYVTYEVGAYAGVPGSSAGAVKFRAGPGAGKTIDGAQIVEAPRKAGPGYGVEAFVPWSAFPEAKKVRVGLRGAIRVYEGDGTTLRAIKATGPGSVESPLSLGWLPTEPEQSLATGLASKKLSWKDVTWDVTTDLLGDALSERAIFAGHYVFVLGPTYKEGKQWILFELLGDPSAVDARDVNQDGHTELLITTRVKAGATTREALSVYTMNGVKNAETPARIFGHETLVSSGSNALTDVVTFGGTTKKPTVTVTYQPPKGWDVASYKEPISVDVDPILFPWGAVKERTFAWNGALFTKDKETAQKPTDLPPVVVNKPAEPTAPKPLATSELVTMALDQYRKEKGLPKGTAPRVEADAVLVIGKKGRAAVFGKDLVIATGDGGYFVVSMARFASDKDVMEVVAKDLTGDGRDEVIVRGIVRAKLTGPGGDKEVLREVMTIYSPAPKGTGLALSPVLTVETARAMESSRVEAQLRIVTAKPGAPGKIELMRGTAKGWTEKTWPFGKEADTGIEPLVLPWGKDVTYTWGGDKFVH